MHDQGNTRTSKQQLLPFQSLQDAGDRNRKSLQNDRPASDPQIPRKETEIQKKFPCIFHLQRYCYSRIIILRKIIN